MDNNSTIIFQTRKWVKEVIIGFNFCPFARRELESDTIHFQVCDETDLEPCLHQLIQECQRLDQEEEIETSLLIFVSAFQNFDDYLELLELANTLIVDLGYEGVYQLASFHPDYCFDGGDVTDAANYTNRSPYPMLHLIREAGLEKALENYPDPESIPQRNIEIAREKGLTEMKQILDNCKQAKDK